MGGCAGRWCIRNEYTQRTRESQTPRQARLRALGLPLRSAASSLRPLLQVRIRPEGATAALGLLLWSAPSRLHHAMCVRLCKAERRDQPDLKPMRDRAQGMLKLERIANSAMAVDAVMPGGWTALDPVCITPEQEALYRAWSDFSLGRSPFDRRNSRRRGYGTDRCVRDRAAV